MRDNTPWADSIRARFADPELQDAVDDFLADTVQPHVTKLEQQTAGLKNAQELYDDLVNDPGGTYLALTRELFDEDVAERIIGSLTGEQPQTPTPTETPAPGNLSDEDMELLQSIKEERAQKAYDDAIEAFRQDGHEDLKPNLFHPFVAGANGDFEKAYASYKQWLDEGKEQFSPTEGTDTGLNPDEVPDLPPTTIGKGEAGATTAPPVQPRYSSIGDAVDDIFRDMSVGAPPTVGSV